ncbi:MAG TPA: hypothetical protein VK928_11460 [Longimicrobiales bacterium]|nr:hypothetical protein [Longimicrobiales bacterium]
MPSHRVMKRVFVVFFLAYAVFTTYPGVLPFSGARPFMLGLPFPLVWVTLWVIGGFVVLLLLDRAHPAAHDDDDAGDA